jgi:pimeloyl-ACP methyl ester carboxylesterase
MRRLLVVALLVTGCGGGAHRAGVTPTPRSTPADERVPPRLSEVASCKDVVRATCSTLRVPLDHSGKTPGTLDLRVAVSGSEGAPVLVFLSGGPGQPGLPFLERTRRHLGAPGRGFRLVVIDQRGTGRNALRCPALQRQMGASDLTPPAAAAVKDCAKRIGDDRRFYATTDTVADLELLRQALGADRIALDGVSYGTYVAERYALAHPDRVSRLVLDSVVPHRGVSLLSGDPIRATARVLGDAATRDLAKVVAREHNGVRILDMLTGLSIGKPHLAPAIAALHKAATGDMTPLNRLAAAVHRAEAAYKATDLSQGLHAATLCADAELPWSDDTEPLNERRLDLHAAAERIQTYPYDIRTATGNGMALQCLYWPPTVPAPELPTALPNVPTLMLAGTKDLSTPMEWASVEHLHAPHAKLMEVAGAGHSVQSQDRPEVKRALARFLQQ